jgi:hypothetical protein
MLAYGVIINATNEYVHLGVNIAMESMKSLCVTIKICFQSTYFRQPTKSDLYKKMNIHVTRRFLGMFVSIDYMYS